MLKDDAYSTFFEFTMGEYPDGVFGDMPFKEKGMCLDGCFLWNKDVLVCLFDPTRLRVRLCELMPGVCV